MLLLAMQVAPFVLFGLALGFKSSKPVSMPAAEVPSQVGVSLPFPQTFRDLAAAH